MIVKFHDDFLRCTDGIKEISVKGSTVGTSVSRVFDRFPQLAVFLMENNMEEGKKTSLLLDGSKYVLTAEDFASPSESDSVLEFGRDIPAGSGKWGMVAVGAVLAVATWGVGAAASAGYMGLSTTAGLGGFVTANAVNLYIAAAGLVLSGLSAAMIKAPTLGGGNSDSATYSFSGISNTTSEGTPIPIVYGEHRVGGHVLNVYTDVVGKNTFLYMQLGLCEGEIDKISSIEINNLPISHYAAGSISYYTRMGTKDQTGVEWFNRVENSVSTQWNNVPLEIGAPQTYETSDKCDAAKVTVRCPAIFKSDGGLKAYEATYKIEYQQADKSPSTDPWFTYNKETGSDDAGTVFSGKTQSESKNDHLIKFPSFDSYRIRVTKLTGETKFSGDNSYQADLFFETVNEIVYHQFDYPHTAWLGLKIKATNQLSGGLPSVTSMVRGIKVSVPTNYDPATRTFNGVWDGKFTTEKYWSDNPAWCLYDLVMSNRYGVADYIKFTKAGKKKFMAQIYMAGTLCDTLVDSGYRDANGAPIMEPRFRLDVVIDSVKAAYEWLSVLTTVLRSALFYVEGHLNVSPDRYQPISHVFTMGNIVSGSYTQTGVSYKNSPNVFEVQFVNRDNKFEQEVFVVEDSDIQTSDIAIEEKRKTLDLTGVTRISQAKRMAKFAILSAKYATKTVSFKAGTEALSCTVGECIGFQHDVPKWSYGGRVVSVDPDTRIVKLSDYVTITADKSYSIRFQGTSSITDPIVISNFPGEFDYVTLSELPENIEISAGDIYVVGETNYEIKPFRVLSVKRNSDEMAELVCVESNQDIYDAADSLDGITVVRLKNYTSLPDPEEISVNDIKLAESVYVATDGTIRTGVDVSFAIPHESSFWDGAYVLYGQPGYGAYESTPLLKNGYAFIPGLQENIEWEIVVTSKFKSGRTQSVSEAIAKGAYARITLKGKYAPPLDVASFVATQDKFNNNYIRFSWEPGVYKNVSLNSPLYGKPDLDLSHYELRVGSTWDTAKVIATHVKEKYYNEYYVTASGSYTFLIKAVDTSGKYSINAAVAALSNVVVEPSDVTGFSAAQNGADILLTWNLNSELDVVGYEIRRGSTWDSAAVVVRQTSEAMARIPGVTEGTHKFFIKAKDRFGSYSPIAASCSVTVVSVATQNALFDFTEDWAQGTHTGTVESGGALTLDSTLKWDSGALWDSGLTWDEASGSGGSFETRVYDFGALTNGIIVLDYEANIESGNRVEILASLSNDGIEWSDYTQFYGGYATTRYAKFTINLISVTGSIVVSRFRVAFLVPDTTYRGFGEIPETPYEARTNGIYVTFPKPFITPPLVLPSVVDDIGYCEILDRTEVGFRIVIWDSYYQPKPAKFAWTATGY